ncbi:MAG: hypothetical protein ACKV2V_05840 [Blastocatellia bacterium]
MKKIGRHFRLPAIIIALVGGCVFYAYSRGAQSPGLEERISKLRAEVNRVPTGMGNFEERISTLEEWTDELAARGKLRIPTHMAIYLYTLRTGGFNEQAHGLAAQAVKILGFVADNAGKTGKLVRTDSSELVAGEYATITLEYTVGEALIPRGGGLRVGQLFSANRLNRLQVADPKGDAWVSFKVISNSATTEAYPYPWRGVFSDLFGPTPGPALKVTSGALKQGDKVIVTLGDRGQGSRGLRMQPRDADDFRFTLDFDFDGQNTFVPGDFVGVKIRGSEPASIRAVVPSVVATGESFALRLAVEDKYFSPATFAGGVFNVRLNGKAVGELRVPAGQYVGKLGNLKLEREGGYKFEVSSADGKFQPGHAQGFLRALP